MLRKSVVAFVMVSLLLGLLTGCGAASSEPAEALAEVIPNFESFTLRLPRLYVQYLETDQGYAEPALWGITASQIEDWFGTDLTMLKIPDFYMDWLRASDIQHIELVHNGSGLFAYVNGSPMPYIAWDADSFALVGDLVQGMGIANGDLLRRMLPLLRHVGLDIVVVMPMAAGAEFIDYRDERAGLMASSAAPEIEAPLAELSLEITYDDEGTPSVFGMPAEVLQPLIGYTPGQLDPAYITQLQEAGVQEIAVQTQGNGLYILVNGQPLPNVAWSDQHLLNALDLYATMNDVSWVPNEQFVSMVRELVLQFSNSEIRIAVQLP